MNLREDSIKYDYLVVFIRHGSAEIWGFQYGVTFGLGTLEIMARTGIFGLVVCALNCATKSDPSEPTRTRTNTNPNDTKANAAGRRGVRVRSANGMCENQGAWAAKCLKKREALVGGVHSGNAHRKAPDLRNTKFHYSRGQKRLFSAQGA